MTDAETLAALRNERLQLKETVETLLILRLALNESLKVMVELEAMQKLREARAIPFGTGSVDPYAESRVDYWKMDFLQRLHS